MSKNAVLSPKQKEIMAMADAGSKISVNVRYIPNNTLPHNEAKEINFDFVTNPDHDATYIGGQQKLQQYIKETVVHHVSNERLDEKVLAAVKFTIDEKGQITNSHIFETSRDKEVDELLLNAIKNMSSWEPATYADGTNVKQEFVLMVGNMGKVVLSIFYHYKAYFVVLFCWRNFIHFYSFI